MNVPAVAKKSFEQLKLIPEFNLIVKTVLESLSKFSSPLKRAKHLHKLVDEYNQEVFSHPLVNQLSPCKQGCSACCHTQVSVTEDEAILLLDCVEKGVAIDQERLKLQVNAGNDTGKYFQMSYDLRKCLFLSDEGTCKVYQNRPSVCRTNAVLGDASQCDTRVSLKPTRLVLTQKADMVIFASFLHSASSGSLPFMLHKVIQERESKAS